MKQRDIVSMTPGEVSALLHALRKVQIASLNPDGSVHLVTMFYAMMAEHIAFWTYRTSQKALNLARDPRITCLVEDGEDYFELRGVQIAGTVRVLEDPDDVLAIGRLIARGGLSAGGVGGDTLEEYVQQAARKRYGYLVDPSRVVSWDHRKLTG